MGSVEEGFAFLVEERDVGSINLFHFIFFSDMNVTYEAVATVSESVVLNLGVVNPFVVGRSFHGGHLQPPENTDIYITISNNSKITVMKSQ